MNPARAQIESPKEGQRNRLREWAPWIFLVLVLVVVRVVFGKWIQAHRVGFTFGWQGLAACVPWVLFSLYWEVAAKNSAPAVVSESRVSRGVHVALGNLAILLIILPVTGLRQRLLPASLLTVATGLTLETGGLALAIWSRRLLGRNWSGEITIKENHDLVRSGPYRVVRHPIYTAVLAMYAGTAIVFGEVHALVGLAIGALAYLRKIRLEEANLRNAFDGGYQEYCRETWTLIPGIF